MNKTEKKIIRSKNKNTKKTVTNETELLITEMKKIGIEKLPYSYSAPQTIRETKHNEFSLQQTLLKYVDKLNDTFQRKNTETLI